MKNKKLVGKPTIPYFRLLKADGRALSDSWHTERTCPKLCASKLKMQTKYSDVKPHGELCDNCIAIAKTRKAAK